MPRQRIEGVKTTEEREKETEEQKELRLGHALNFITTRIMKKYNGKDLDKIGNQQHREIVKIIRDINVKYGENKKGRRKKVQGNNQEDSKQKILTALANLLESRNATENQIRILATYYGVDAEEIGFSQDNENEEELHKEH